MVDSNGPGPEPKGPTDEGVVKMGTKPSEADVQNAKESIAPDNKGSIWGSIVVGVEDFLTSQPVKIAVSAGNGLTFYATNELGVKYLFEASGTLTLKGTPQ